MNTPQKELTLEESIAQVMQTLPPVIRDYLAQGKYTQVARNLTTKYGLRVDQSGVLEREMMLLLMGIDNPDAFAQSLIEDARIDKDTLDKIMQDVNTQIFIPLRREEQQSKSSAPQPQSVKPATPVAVAQVVSRPAAPLPPHVAPLPPKTVMPTASSRPTGTLGDVVRSVIAAPAALKSDALLEDHEEPHIELSEVLRPVGHDAASPSAVSFKVEPQAPVMARQPMSGAIPANLPGAVAAPAARPAPIAPKAELPQQAPIAPIKSYGADPYREPVDESPAE